MVQKIKNILSLSNDEVYDFFLKEENYSTIDLPEYFTFSEVLSEAEDIIKTTDTGKIQKGTPKECDNVNYKIITNKDGMYAWRMLQLIHPILYVNLISIIRDNWGEICNRFECFQRNKRIQCVSIPVVSSDSRKSQKSKQILAWWEEFEQNSIIRALDFSYLYKTDITDCYGSIYTHSIAWALHDKEHIRKNMKDTKLVGNKIDKILQKMSYRQTNGIPQGSVVMDFISEMVLGYADLMLSDKLEKLGISDYHIIRYRDDYRIFVNDQSMGDKITKILTEVLIGLGLKINPNKTSSTKNLILGSIKSDKIDLISSSLPLKDYDKKKINNQKLLLQIYDFADKHQNSGQLKRILSDFYEKIKIDREKDNLNVLTSIVVDLAYNNPSLYNICIAIISKIIDFMQNDDEKLDLINKIKNKFDKLPNTGFMDIWLQRVSYKISENMEYSEKLCDIVRGNKTLIWNSDWLDEKYKNKIDKCNLVDNKKIKDMNTFINQGEVDAFKLNYDDEVSNWLE